MIELAVLERSAFELSPEGATFLRLMADPTRRRIFSELMKGETCNCEMAGLLGLAQNLVSHHLRQLRHAGLIRTRRDERDQRWIYYSIHSEALGRLHDELTAFFDPSRVGEREPRCGPAQQESG